MTLTIETHTDRKISLDEFLEHLQQNFDPADPDSAIAAAESFRALANNETFLTERVDPLVATAELTEGANDYQDYYCPKIEWIWGDGTQSESGEDCEPYEAGKSEIRRRYTADHNFRSDPASGGGSIEVIFRMKQGSKIVLSLRQTIKVQGH